MIWAWRAPYGYRFLPASLQIDRLCGEMNLITVPVRRGAPACALKRQQIVRSKRRHRHGRGHRRSGDSELDNVFIGAVRGLRANVAVSTIRDRVRPPAVKDEALNQPQRAAGRAAARTRPPRTCPRLSPPSGSLVPRRSHNSDKIVTGFEL